MERNVTAALLSLRVPVLTRLAAICSAVVAIWSTVGDLIVCPCTRRLRGRRIHTWGKARSYHPMDDWTDETSQSNYNEEKELEGTHKHMGIT